MIDLSVKIGNMILNNPIMPASGTFGYGEEYKDFFDLNTLGAVVTKGLSIDPKAGNLPPRIYEGERFLINSIGLENIGIERFISEKLPFLKNIKCPTIVNFFGNSEEQYYKIAEKLNFIDEIDGVEVNVSCPNVKKGGIEFGLDEKLLFNITKNLRSIIEKKALIVKLSPISSDIISLSKACQEGGADGLTMSNTLKGLSVDSDKMLFNIGNKIGGISGPLLKPLNLRIIYEVRKFTDIPIIGVGGISNLKDALDYFAVGADAVQVGTANFSTPDIMHQIICQLKDYLQIKKINNIRELRIHD